MIKARELKGTKLPGKTELYEMRDSREIAVEEKQEGGSLDQVILEYCVGEGDVGYFAKEYRPANVPKTGAKVIDITAVMLNHAEKCVRWHLYDIKDTLAGEHTVVQLSNQWNAGLQYLQKNILAHLQEYSEKPDIGVITRLYDEERMKRLKDEYQRRCNEIERNRGSMSLSQKKKRTGIAKERGILRAAKAILDKSFQAENEGVYPIHIRELVNENDQVYNIRFPV